MLLAILGVDGAVRNVFVINSLSHGVTENSVEAVRRMKFVPATKDGRPVSQLVRIEYNFNLY